MTCASCPALAAGELPAPSGSPSAEVQAACAAVAEALAAPAHADLRQLVQGATLGADASSVAELLWQLASSDQGEPHSTLHVCADCSGAPHRLPTPRLKFRQAG